MFEELSAKSRNLLVTGSAAILFSACSGGGVSEVIPAPPPIADDDGTTTPDPIGTEVAPTLAETFSSDFRVGVAMHSFQLDRGDISVDIAAEQFNSLTPEFQMKADEIAPVEGVYNFEAADQLVDWAIENGMQVRGHALVWHEATPDYFYEGTPEEIRARLEEYVTTVVTHFRGRIQVWDVVNEVTSVDLFNGEDGIGPDRPSEWYEAVGSADYVDWAFRAARAADPSALLFINDFETENPQKRAWLIEIVERLQSRGVPIDGIGHQMHMQPDTTAEEALAAIDDVDNQFLGVINHITELDMSAYNNPGECWERQVNCPPDLGPTPPADFINTQAQVMRDLFTGLAERPSVESVTTWGVIDSDSWLNFTPVERYNYPLLFDRDGNPKPAYEAITDEDYVIGGEAE